MIDPRLSVAPMMAWTDRHCRFFHRRLTRRTLLYTEMVTTGALLHGDVPAHLDFDASEHPLALQLGGSEPDDLAACARLAQRWGYDEINLNCGCPSERVRRGAFGACLMAEPLLVRDAVRAMRDACELPVTVKHRIGIDRVESYEFVRDFVGTVAQGGVAAFIVHARNAWLQGLSPKENREIPPLRYELAYRLKTDFPSLTIVVNGGVVSFDQVDVHRRHVDGVMIGREAYHNPWLLADADRRAFGEPAADDPIDRWRVAADMADYARSVVRRGEPLRNVTRHLLGLFNGLPGARRWRQALSDSRRLAANDPSLIVRAAEGVRPDGRLAA
ncbi:MAG: tRNA dihydrouridine(20/20a) synthase DusA [Burkholderiaceae bacterium]